MAITKTTTLADTIPTIIEEARFTEQFKAVMSGLVWNIKKKLHEGSTINVPYFGTVTASALTEGVDMTSSQTMADTNVPITPGEVGCKIIITDKLARDNQEDILRAAGRILGDAMAVKRDGDLLDELDDGTTTLGAGTTATLGQFAAARAILAGNAVSAGGPAPQPYVCVHHPFVYMDLVDVLTPLIPGTAGNVVPMSGIADEVVRNYGVGKLFGVPMVEDGNLDTTTCKGGMFSSGKGGGIILATADEWDVKPERDESLRATELNIVGEYGVGEYLAGWIVELYHDAATPG